MTMPAQRLKEIRERERKATKGPWRMVSFPKSVKVLSERPNINGISDLIARAYSWAHKGRKAAEYNGDFIAHARSDVPDLVDALDEAVELVKRLRANSCEWWPADSDAEAFLRRVKGE